MNDDLVRLKRISGILSIILLVFMIAIASMAMLLACGLVLAVTVPEFLDAFVQELDMKPEWIYAFIGIATLALCLMTIILLMLRNITKAIHKNYSPFTKENVKRLMVIATLYLVMPFVSIAIIILTIGGMTLMEALVMIAASAVMAAIFYMLALIFDYGCQLQKESDETL